MISNKYLAIIGVTVVMVLCGKLYTWHKEQLDIARASVVTEYDLASIKDLEQQLEISKEFLEASANQINELYAKNHTISLERDNALISLSKRPSRGAAAQQGDNLNHNTTCANTGRELSREDAEFLTREASDAATVVAERDLYYKLLTEQIKALEKLNESRTTND